MTRSTDSELAHDDHPASEDAWPSGWDGHERAQLRRMARWPLAQKLAWLEEMHRVVAHLQTQSTSKDAE